MRQLISTLCASCRALPWLVAAACAACCALPALGATPATDDSDGLADEVISLPLRELGLVIDREGKGVYLPYSELLKLWELAREKTGEPEPVPPAAFVVRSARLDGRLEGDEIALTAVFDVELLTDDWTFVELGLRGVALTRALDADAPLPLQGTQTDAGVRPSMRIAPKAAAAELRGKGTHTLTVEGMVPLEEKGTRFALTIPQAPISLVELSVPVGRKLDIQGALLSGTESSGGTTRHAFLLGNAGDVLGTLSAADEAPRAPGVVYARTDTAIAFRRDVVETRTRVTATVRHAPIETISLLLPEDVRVAAVAGDVVADWAATPVEDGQRVVVRLKRHVADQAMFDVRTEAFYDRTDTTLDATIPVVEGATDARGFVGVGRAPVARVFVASVEGMVRANSAELADTGVPVTDVYRFRQQPVRMTLGLEWPVERFRVFDTTLLDLQRDAVRLDGMLVVSPVEGALFDLDIAVPPAYEILDAAGAPSNAAEPFAVHWNLDEPAEPGGQRVLHVRLPHKVQAPQALVLVINARKLRQAALASPDPGARATEQLGGFIVQGAERQTGFIAIAADPSYLVDDTITSGLEPAPIEALNAAGIAGAGLRFGYTYRTPPFAAELAISKKRPRLYTATGTTVAVHGDVIDVLALSEFSIADSTLNDILLRLPASVDPDNVEITGDDIRDRRLLTTEEKAALGLNAADHVWQITLDVGKSGVYALSVAYQVQVGGGEATRWIPLLDYRAMPELEADRGFVVVIANREIELGTTIVDARVREMDKADLPRHLFPSTPVARVLFAYQYPSPPAKDEALGLIVTRHEPADVLPVLVENAEIVVCVSRADGAFTEASYRVLNTSEAALRMRLPAKSLLWAVLVGGSEIKPRQQTDGEQTVYVIPISSTSNPDEAQEILVRYWTEMPKLKRGGGSYRVRLPAFDNLRVGKARLTVFQPDEYRFVRFGGNMNPKAEIKQLPLLVRWFKAADETLQEPLVMPVMAGVRQSPRRAPRPSEEFGEMGDYAADEDGVEGFYPEEEAELDHFKDAEWYETLEGEPSSKAREQILAKLETNIPKVDFEDAELKEIIRFLSRETGVNIVIDPVVFAARAEGGRPGIKPDMSIHLGDVPLKDVLKYVLRYNNLKYVVEDYAILVIPRDYVLPEELETEVFRLSTTGPGTTLDAQGERKPETIKEWLRGASGVTWPVGSDIVYHEETGTLIVTNTPTNVALIRELITIWDKPSAGQTITPTWPAVGGENQVDRLPEVGAFSAFYAKGMVRGLLSLNITIPVAGVDVPFERLSGGGEVVVRYASTNSLGRAQTIVIILTLLLGYGLRRVLGWKRVGFVVFLAVACTIAPGLGNYWGTLYWDMVAKGVLLLAGVFFIEYVITRVRHRHLTKAAAVALLVALAAPAVWAEEPASPATVIEEGGKRIYIPFTQVDRAVLGKDTRVFVSLDEFIRLWERAYPEAVRVKPPRAYALTNAAYHGRIRKADDGTISAAFTARFDLLVLSDAWTVVPLPFGATAIEKVTLDGAEAPLTMRDATPTLVFEKAGRHTLEIEFTRPVVGVPEEGSVRLTMPPVAVGVLELEAPAESLEFRTEAGRQQGTTTTEDGTTTYRMPVGGLAEVGVSWWRPGVTRTVGRAIYHHDALVRLYVDERLVLAEFTSTLRLVRGQLDAAVYDVPPGVNVLNVTGEGLADWRLDESDGARALEVEFAQPLTSEATLVIDLALALPGLDTAIALPDVRLRGAQSDRGTIELHARHGLDVLIVEGEGLEPKLKPSGTRTLAETGLTYEPRAARAYPRRPFSLTFEARRIPDEWKATVQTLYTALESRLTLETRLILTVRSGSIYELLVELPAGFEVVELGGPQVAGWRIANRDTNLLAIDLANEQTSAFEVRLVAERLLSGMPAALQLRAPRVLDVAHGAGVLGAAFPPAWEVIEPKYADGMASIPLRETPSWMRAAGANVRLAARYWEGVAPEVEFGLRQAETRLSATVAHHLTVLSDEVSLRVLVAYSIDGKAVRELSFTAPVEVRDTLRVVGAGVRGQVKRTGETPDGRDVWTVAFHSPAAEIASFEVRWRGEIPVERTLDVPRIGAVDAELETVFVSVENRSTNDVQQSTAAELAELPVEQVPVVPPGVRPADIVLAYRAEKPAWGLKLSIRSYEVQQLIKAQILSAAFETVLDREGRARTRMSLVIRNRTEQFLRVKFPEPIELWALSVAGEPAQPSVASGDGSNTYLFPLIKTGLADLPFEVVAVYSHKSDGDRRRAWSGGLKLNAPEIEGLPTNRTVWKLWLPEGYRTVRFGGNMERIEEARWLVEELEDLAKQYEQQRIIAVNTVGGQQRLAVENLREIEQLYRDKSTVALEELRRNEELLAEDDASVRKFRNVSRGVLEQQQSVSERKLKTASETFERSYEEAQAVVVESEREQRSQQGADRGQFVLNNDAISNWGTNVEPESGQVTKELERASQQREGDGALRREAENKKRIVEDKSVQESIKGNLLYGDMYSNARIYVTEDARSLQRRAGVGRDEYSLEVSGDLDARWLGELRGQFGYAAHTARVTRQAARPGARSLAFDIPRDGRLFVFSKLNAEARLEVRQLRASAAHGIKTVIALAVLVAAAWAIGRARLTDRVSRWADGRRVLATFLGLTALLVLIVLIGRFRYPGMNVLLVIAAIVWGAAWLARHSRRKLRAVAAGGAPVQTTPEEDNREKR